MYPFFKRLFDIIVSLIAFPIFAIVWVVVAIAIKIEDGGPIFYYDHRIAKGSKEFIMYKFRSMKVNAPMIVNKDGSSYNADDDPRVTKIGHFLRKTSIDELPQIINVIKGDMSIVGPRASAWQAIDTYLEDEIDKMKVRPGITGYTQAYFRNSISTREKRLYDAWYANNVTLVLDIKILLRTVKTVFKRENLYSNEGTIVNSAEVSKEMVSVGTDKE